MAFRKTIRRLISLDADGLSVRGEIHAVVTGNVAEPTRGDEAGRDQHVVQRSRAAADTRSAPRQEEPDD